MVQTVTTTKPRLLMADDHSMMLAGLRKLVEDQCEVVGTVQDGRALVEAAERLRPDVILIDISMPLLNGMDAARQIKKSVPDAKLLFLTMHASPVFATEALQVGAMGYLLKQSAASELLQAIETVLKGQTYLTPSITRPVLDSMATHKPRMLKKSLMQLTPRQREVLQLVAEGKNTKDIAVLLNLSIKTVEFHKTRIMMQLNLHSALELAKFAIAEGLVSAETGLS
mgnify:CR=1 FL=1